MYYRDERTCVRQMLTKWKDTSDSEATWEKIVIALRKIGNNVLAKEVEEQLSERQALEKQVYQFKMVAAIECIAMKIIKSDHESAWTR